MKSVDQHPRSVLEKAPFWVVKIYPGDIGTKGGLVINEFGQVMRVNDTPLEGLYACGNSTASVMGSTYPSAGGTVGPAMVFAYIAMTHLATTRSRAGSTSITA
ncbi:FAD-binding protein [Paraburkholderia phytofirmans]|uniref:FAD-binding protein n=1 Tax=Paraburkholderia phytofirmans TaxID=261302 RepID=UPI0038B8AFBD